MPEPELVDHVARSTGLSQAEAVRVIDDVTAFYSESVEDYVRRRHRELQEHGVRNAEIFRVLADEATTRRFPAPTLTERQLRRLVYT
ncbi:hypothetical protein P0W64_19840 [Tsukamurella sp. 8F]|uniref:hypothetical protein n=1 Tax=unclassified Tsukamurella TaxID=2633480 RepID=UPI0023BA1259|nr:MULTISPECIES: hypothetical protein [unclassified Tsukamurella]MDF0531798.1 hypothetical protein [Tsukamurella sp. 8J]MDF0589040.1 hypothetical protein [Tsukamurella sp. 8F]